MAIRVLGVESSCDETSVAIVETPGRILSVQVSSQVPLHRPYGGVVPEIASRAHLARIEILYRECLREAKIDPGRIDAVAATRGPGLASSLLVGATFAKALAVSLGKPFLGIHHVAAHFYALVLEAVRSGDPVPEPPFLGLAVSGGHTMLVRVDDWDSYRLLGGTLDDAAGEAFDKVAAILGLGYPGGPAIDRTARGGDERAVRFPRGLARRKGTMDFSFSGLKTAVLYHARECGETLERRRADIAASFQASVVETLVERARTALETTGARMLGVVGGVACNRRLRSRLRDLARETGVDVRIPGPDLCTDNAAMVAGLGSWLLSRAGPDDLDLDVVPDLALPAGARGGRIE